ncbi:hypothetical protein TGAMA5MH_09051 [Trichoderma gamsii]|uniref:NAD(P)-binding protein n=1 Tax=Trichoderma gamsii TaxID=398673 RepID=A0A2K0SZW8_9HYPO|nr:hypothetical protein TGAMA5MH_09051 [Trichoderma gamsii]
MATTANTHPLGITGFALVTGGGSGIGRATCLLLAREGCAGICVADISSKAASTVVAELQQVASNSSFKATQYALDVVDAKSVQMMITKVVEEFGRVDYAVNCAGIGAIKHGLAETGQDEWDRMIAVNLTGVFACVKEEIQQMMKQEPFQTSTYAPLQRGAIVNIASLSGLVGLRHSGAYTAAKHGVVGITQTAALDYPEVKSNAVVPGYIKTPLTSVPGEMQRNALEKVNNWTPMKRFGLPEEVAEGIVWLLGSRSNFVHGTCLTIDGGYLSH